MTFFSYHALLVYSAPEIFANQSFLKARHAETGST
ncbi:hypothetical protein MED193_05126 [Roseobacter sp. MED193]|nr:hypothetical protein MED193_05126 [Roseobacter sp. MED193]